MSTSTIRTAPSWSAALLSLVVAAADRVHAGADARDRAHGLVVTRSGLTGRTVRDPRFIARGAR